MRFLFGMTAKDTCAHIVLWAHDRTGRPLCDPSGATVVLFTKPTAPYAGPAICQRCVDDVRQHEADTWSTVGRFLDRPIGAEPSTESGDGRLVNRLHACFISLVFILGRSVRSHVFDVTTRGYK